MSNTLKTPIAISVGEPAGIGPDILITLLQHATETPLHIFSDQTLLEKRAKQLGLNFQPSQQITINHIPLPEATDTGTLNVANAEYVIKTIEQATQACLENRCRALVTGPVHKGVINEAGIHFTGHTEYLAKLTNTQRTVMMLANQFYKVALLTTHIPLSQVPQAITTPSLKECIHIIHKDLQKRFNITTPRILVCGLNPHAGESGHLGREEIDIIEPTLKILAKENIHVIGPVSADTAFTHASLARCDIVLAMYHDQGLTAIKSQGFGETVNITLGLPLVRTSVDHGVALDLAGTGKACFQSLKTAISMADELTRSPSP